MLHLSLKQINVLHAILRGGSTTAAAEALHISQPAVSKLVASMEKELRYPLFVRTGRGLEPTPEAIALMPYVERTLSELQRLQQHAENLRGGSSGHLAIAGNLTLVNSLAATAMATFRKHYPDINVELTILSGAEIQAAVLSNKADIGLIYGPFHHDHIHTERIGEWPIRCVLPRSHPLSALKQIHVRELEDQPILTYSAETPTGLAIRRLFENIGVRFQASVVLSNTPAVLQLVAEGLGIGLVDYWDFFSDSYPGLTSRMLVPRIENHPMMIFSAHSQRNRAVELMASLIRPLAARMR